ncbi:hypothetical protein [Streptomyces sp. NPDC056600]|uniref:hypothetical protein n=1 Tax=Streptomyces sp. NPDC056600 TaxID=3345874 RepID=UPI0036B2EF1D
MSQLRLTWNLSGQGWADCTVSDDQGEAVVMASYITTAPEDLLTAVARLLAGQSECRAQFDAEPTAFRWIFHRDGTTVRIRLLQLARGSDQDNRGTEIWSSRQDVDVVARAVIRCFDQVVWEHGESAYRSTWGEHFPRTQLEALRTVWREHRGDRSSSTQPQAH